MPPDVEEATSYEDYTVEELKDELRGRGLHTSGNKDELMTRLEEDDAAAEAGNVVAEQQPGVEPAAVPVLPTDNPYVINTLEKPKSGILPDRFPPGQVDATNWCASPMGMGEGKPGYTPAGGSGPGGANQALRHGFADETVANRTSCANGTPIVGSVAPGTGLHTATTPVTIKGTRFTGATGVTIGAAATAVVVKDDSTITCTAPTAAAAGAVNVVVTTPAGTGTLTNGFTYT